MELENGWSGYERGYILLTSHENALLMRIVSHLPIDVYKTIKSVHSSGIACDVIVGVTDVIFGANYTVLARQGLFWGARGGGPPRNWLVSPLNMRLSHTIH